MFFLKETYSGVYPKGSYYTFNVKLKAKRFLKLSLSLQKEKKKKKSCVKTISPKSKREQ